MLFRRIYISLCLLFFSGFLWGQDIHFSQFYANPLSLNPAMTGVMNGCYRGHVTHRSQWKSYTVPYQTIGAAADMKTLHDKLLGSDFVGGGLSFFNDRSGDVGLTVNNLMLAGAYHKMLSDVHRIGVGVEAGYGQKRMDFTKLILPGQIGDNRGNNAGPGGETFDNGVSYFDLHAGLLWTGIFSDIFSAFLGGSAFHLNRPQASFTQNEHRLYRRYVLHGGANVKTGVQFTLIPNAIVMYQQNAKEINIGTSFEYNYPNNRLPRANFSLGSWFRYSDNVDALILVAGVEYKRFKVGVSYDITLSALQAAANKVGGLELSLTYTGACQKRKKSNLIPCPRF